MLIAAEVFNIQQRLEYLKLYGNHTMAYSLLQQHMEYFDVPEIGFLGYRKYGNTEFVLSNPICADKDLCTLVGLFLENHHDACFVQITEPFSSFLRESFHFYTVQMGIETWIDGVKWSLSGPSKTHLRRWINTAKNAGLTVSDLSQADIVAGRYSLQDEWLQTRAQTRALTFLTREVYSDPAFAGLTRLFGAYKGKELLSIVEFDPIFDATRVSAYYVNVVQFKKEAPNGTSDYIVSEAFSQFVKEGALKLSFGMSPLARLSPCVNEPPFVRCLGSWLYRNANSFYNFKGNYFHKEKYRGDEIPVFYATRKWNALPDVFRLFRLVGIV